MPIHPTAKIHPSAIVHSSAVISKDVEIGPYSIIGQGSEIGAGTKIGAYCIFEFCTVGSGNIFTASSFIGIPPQDWSYKGENTRLIIGDNNIIRENVTISRGTAAGEGITKLGSRCMLMANSHIAHDCLVGNDVVLVNNAALAGHSVVHDKVIISGLCGVHQFVTIGTLAMISGGGMVSQDILPYVIAKGNPARPFRLNSVGLRRAGMNAGQIRLIKHVYDTLFFKHLLLKDAISKLREEKLNEQASLMLNFAETSKRGIARPLALAGQQD